MNKKISLFIPVIALLGACNNKPSPSSSSLNMDSSESEESLPSEDSSTKEESSEIESSEESSEMESSSEEEEALTNISIGFDDIPAPVNGNEYPSDNDIEVGDAIFHIGGVMQNTGKFKPTNTIQVKSISKGDAGYFENITPIKGTLTIIIMKNYVEYNHTDMSGELTVTAHNKDGSIEQELEVVSLGDENGKYIFTYEKSDEHYYRIENLSNYAVYATDIMWEE